MTVVTAQQDASTHPLTVTLAITARFTRAILDGGVFPLLLIVAMTTFAQKTPATQNQQSVNILLLIATTIMRVLWIVVA
jgi:hypothetical protein